MPVLKYTTFRSILISTNDGLTKSDLETLVFLASDLIGSEREKENIKSGLDLFEILIKRDVLNETSVDYLRDLLLRIRRFDLWKNLGKEWDKWTQLPPTAHEYLKDTTFPDGLEGSHNHTQLHHPQQQHPQSPQHNEQHQQEQIGLRQICTDNQMQQQELSANPTDVYAAGQDSSSPCSGLVQMTEMRFEKPHFSNALDHVPARPSRDHENTSRSCAKDGENIHFDIDFTMGHPSRQLDEESKDSTIDKLDFGSCLLTGSQFSADVANLDGTVCMPRWNYNMSSECHEDTEEDDDDERLFRQQKNRRRRGSEILLKMAAMSHNATLKSDDSFESEVHFDSSKPPTNQAPSFRRLSLSKRARLVGHIDSRCSTISSDSLDGDSSIPKATSNLKSRLDGGNRSSVDSNGSGFSVDILEERGKSAMLNIRGGKLLTLENSSSVESCISGMSADSLEERKKTRVDVLLKFRSSNVFTSGYNTSMESYSSGMMSVDSLE